jgi:hypothetical protein
VVVAFARELDAGPPQGGLPDPRTTLEPQRDPIATVIQKSGNTRELRFAADDILEREPSFPDCRQSCLLFPSVRLTVESGNKRANV